MRALRYFPLCAPLLYPINCDSDGFPHLRPFSLFSQFGGEGGDEDDDDEEDDGDYAPPEGGEGKPECKQQ